GLGVSRCKTIFSADIAQVVASSNAGNAQRGALRRAALAGVPDDEWPVASLSNLGLFLRAILESYQTIHSPKCPTRGPSGYLRAHSRNLQIDAVHAAARRDKKRLPILAAPVQVRDDLRREYCGDVFASRRENPHAPGSRAVQIPRLIDFDPVGTSFARIRCGIEEDLSLGQRAIRFHPVAHPGLLRLGIADVEELLVWRKDDAIGPRQILDQELQIFPLWR